MNDFSKEDTQDEVGRKYPAGYTEDGFSLNYNESFVSRSMDSLRLFITRPLRFGSISHLHLVDVSNSMYPDIPSPSFALKEYIRTSFGEKGIPVYIFDDHNHALYAWFEALEEEQIEQGVTLFHFDDHLDGKKVANLPYDQSLAEIARYSQQQDFDTFIDPARKMRLIHEVYWIRRFWREKRVEPEDDFEIPHFTIGSNELIDELKGQALDPKKIIVDIDLDYFGPNVHDEKWEEEEIVKIKELMSKAGVITFALSPGFINELRAIDLVKRILSN